MQKTILVSVALLAGSAFASPAPQDASQSPLPTSAASPSARPSSTATTESNPLEGMPTLSRHGFTFSFDLGPSETGGFLGGIEPSNLEIPPPCQTAMANLFTGGCKGMDAVFHNTHDNPLTVPSLASTLAACICYTGTASVYAPSFVDGEISKCYNDILSTGGGPLQTDAPPKEFLGLCKRVGDVKASQTSSGGAGASSKPTGSTASTGASASNSASATATGAGATASGKNAANSMKVDWIVMGSASFLAIGSAIAALL